jgi:hypothetical protein
VNFQSRSFVQSHIYRPTPIVHFSANEKIILILTPWGSPENAETIQQIILNYITSVGNDREATSPFQRISTLSPTSNTLRTAVLLANDMLYKNRNKNEYFEGYEIYIGMQKVNEFSFISFGHPHCLLNRPEKSILPLTIDFDHALNLSSKQSLSPLPSSLIGIQSYVELPVKSMTPKSGDQFLFLNRSWINQELILIKDESKNFDGYIKALTKTDETAFWFGLLDF